MPHFGRLFNGRDANWANSLEKLDLFPNRIPIYNQWHAGYDPRPTKNNGKNAKRKTLRTHRTGKCRASYKKTMRLRENR